jgi:hypothetical protein
MNLKQEIIKELDRFENPDVLEEILAWIRSRESGEKLLPMSEALKKRVARGEQQIREGKLVSHDEVMKEIEEWLH